MTKDTKNNREPTAFSAKKPWLARAQFLWLGNLVLLIAIVIIALHWGDWRVFLRLLMRIKLKWLGLAVLFQLGTYVCVTTIWKVVLRSCDISISVPNLFALSIAKLFSDQTVPSFGISGSVVAMRGFIRRKSSAGAAAAAVIMNTTSRYLPYFALFNIAMIIVWKNHMLNKGLQFVAVIFSIIISVLTLAVIGLIWLVINKRIPRSLRRFRKLAWFLQSVQKIPAEILKRKSLWMVAFTANMAIFLLDSGTLWILLSSLSAPIRISHVFASFMISSVVTDIAIIPGRIGIFEGSSITLLHLFNIPIEQAIAAIVLFRGFTYWLPMIPGFIITRREFQKK